MTSFKIGDVFRLETKGLIVITGHLISGQIEIGMLLITENSNLEIKSIEAIRSNENDLIALTFDNHSIEITTLELLKNMIVFFTQPVSPD
jgi:hypothetical protein